MNGTENGASERRQFMYSNGQICEERTQVEVLTGGKNPQGSGHFLLFISQLCQSGVLETSQEYWNCVLSDQEHQNNIKSVIVSKSPRIGADNSDNYLVRFV